MPPAPKHNWNYLYDVYQKFLEEKPGTSSSEFARKNGISEEACRKAFKRLEDKRTIRTESGRTNGRKKTSIFEDVTHEEVAEVVKHISSPRIVALHAKVLATLYTELEYLKTLQAVRVEKDDKGQNKIKIETTRDLKDSVQTSNEIVRTCREIMPFISELKDRTGVEDVINRLMNREIDVTQAALELSQLGVNLPEAIKIMLAKVPPVVIAQNFKAPLDDDELDQRALEVLQQVKWQYECFLPQRRQEVIELKKEMKGAETFAPESEEGKENE